MVVAVANACFVVKRRLTPRVNVAVVLLSDLGQRAVESPVEYVAGFC